MFFMATLFDLPKSLESLFGTVDSKAAFETGTKFATELTDFAKGNVEALMASAQVATTGAQALGQGAADYGRKSFESATATMKTLGSVKTPADLFQIQSDFAKSYFESAIAEGTKMRESLMKLAGEVTEPISKRAALAVEKIKTVAK
jgi:phasin family protein